MKSLLSLVFLTVLSANAMAKHPIAIYFDTNGAAGQNGFSMKLSNGLCFQVMALCPYRIAQERLCPPRWRISLILASRFSYLFLRPLHHFLSGH